MLASITPLGERSRGRSWTVTVAAFVVGAVVGGAALGVAAGGLAWSLAPVPAVLRWSVVAALAVVVAIGDSGGRLPSWRRQVDVRWLTDYRGWVVGLGYGAQLGAAVVTVVPTGATWLVLLVAAASGSPATAVTICVVFAVARAAPVLLTARVRTPAALHAMHSRLARLGPPVDGATRVLVWAATGGVAALTAVRLAA